MKSAFFTSVLLLTACVAAAAQSQGQSQGKLEPPPAAPPSPTPALKTGAAPAAATSRGTTVEEIVARVNAEIITNVDLEKSKSTVTQEVRDDCTSEKCTPEQLQQEIEQRQKDALRDLIDQSLLIQRAKDLGISVETDLIRQLDAIRMENKLATMEDLQKAVEEQGIDYEEFKNNRRNALYTDAVISREVTQKITGNIDRAEMLKYYNEHKEEFQRPETVYLREILVSTEGKPESDIAALQKKAESLRTRVLGGEDFSDLAKHFSDGATAAEGGELGGFSRGKLKKDIEDAVFSLNRKEMTPVIHTDKGFLIYQVEERYEAGIQPFDKMENEVMGRITATRGPERLRAYLTTLRKDSFVEVRPGYVDTGGATESNIAESKAPVDDPNAPQKSAKKHKRFLLF